MQYGVLIASFFILQALAAVDLEARGTTRVDGWREEPSRVLVAEGGCFVNYEVAMEVGSAGGTPSPAEVSPEASIEAANTSSGSGRRGGIFRLRGLLLPDGGRASRADAGPQGAQGKVNLEAARRFAASTSFFGQAEGGHGGVNAGDLRAADTLEQSAYGEGENYVEERPVAVISAIANGGDVTLESLSWKDSIKRKFGMA